MSDNSLSEVDATVSQILIDRCVWLTEPDSVAGYTCGPSKGSEVLIQNADVVIKLRFDRGLM